jgi:tetratricopeptide (TPR) repeat protein
MFKSNQTDVTTSNLSNVLKELRFGAKECATRGLKVSGRFALELINGSIEKSSPLFDHVVIANGSLTGLSSSFFDEKRRRRRRVEEEGDDDEDDDDEDNNDNEDEDDEDVYNLAKSFFEDRQFLRASTLLERRDAMQSAVLTKNGGDNHGSSTTSTHHQTNMMSMSSPFKTIEKTDNSLPMDNNSSAESEVKSDAKARQLQHHSPILNQKLPSRNKRRSLFLKLYSRFLDGENRKEAERAQGGDSLARTKAPTNPSLALILAELVALDDQARELAKNAKFLIQSSTVETLEKLFYKGKERPVGTTISTSSSSSSSSMVIDDQQEQSQTSKQYTSFRLSLTRPFEVFSSHDNGKGNGGRLEKEAAPSWNVPGESKRDELMSELPQWHASILAGIQTRANTSSPFSKTLSNDGIMKNKQSQQEEEEEKAKKKVLEEEEEEEEMYRQHSHLFSNDVVVTPINTSSTTSGTADVTIGNKKNKKSRGLSAIGLASLDLTTYPMDGYLLWLLGVVLRELDRHDEARSAFLRATRLAPYLWSAWADLVTVCSTRAELEALHLPNHFIAHIFKAYALLELQASSPAALQSLQAVSAAFPRSSFVKAMAAKALYNLRRIDQAQVLFESLRSQDPHRIEDMDIYSNILYVKGETARLATLAHELFSLDRFTPQTCCVVGNYFSSRREHEKAVVYFRRCLRLNPQFLSAWTLMGHEYVELKNTAAAIECYRRAVDGNSRDYRAWYGLGQTYELLQMYLYASYYYRRACALRPKDSRMWCALGTCFENLERKGDAIACFERAAQYSDRNGIAALRLARLYRDAAGNIPAACKWFAIFIEERENAALDETVATATKGEGYFTTSSTANVTPTVLTEMGPELSEALLFLAKSAWEEGRLGDAETFAARVLSTPSISAAGGKEARVFLNSLRASVSDKTKEAQRASSGAASGHGQHRGMIDKSNPSTQAHQSSSTSSSSSSLLAAAPRGRKNVIASGGGVSGGGGGGGGSIISPPVASSTPQHHHHHQVHSSSSSLFPPPQSGWLSGGGGNSSASSGISLSSPPLLSGIRDPPGTTRISSASSSSAAGTSGDGSILSTPINSVGGVSFLMTTTATTPAVAALNELEPGILEPSPALSRGISFTRGSASGTRRGGGGVSGGVASSGTRRGGGGATVNNLSFEPLLSNSPSSMDSSGGGGGGGVDVTAGASPLLQGIDATISLDLASPSIALSFGSGGGGGGGAEEGVSGDGMDVDESG